MALKVYKKHPVKINRRQRLKGPETLELPIDKPDRPITLWDILAGIKHDFLTLLQTSTLARILIPLLLISFGTYILYGQIYPEIKQRAREAAGYYDPTRAELVKGDSIQPKETYLSDPGSEYFKKLTQSAEAAHILEDDPVSKNYNGKFSLSIPSLGLNNLPVQANVESGVEEVYDSVLNNGLAHFKDTGLPMSEINNNSVVYGHASNGNYYERTKDVAAAFTKLTDIKIGDEVIVKIEGKEYKYRVVKTKLVKPDDISIINGTRGKKTLTLFTCPNGNNAKRFVAVARPV